MSGSKSLPPAAENPNATAASLAASMLDAPLTMTVHDLPTPGAPVAARQVSGRLKMLAVLLVCAAPVIASYVTFYVVRPSAQRNYGTLITPVRGLPDVQTTALDGKATNLLALKDQWLLVSVANAACDAACEKHIYLQRQLRESLGRDKDRLDRVWLVTDDAPVLPALVPQVNAPQVDAYALRVSETQVAQWLAPEPGHKLSDHLYLVDPQGNWMMRFPADIDAVKAKRDIERLLRAANSWDRAGRDKVAP
jgi:hypothetical protein